MGRPPKVERGVRLPIIMPADLLEALDAWVEEIHGSVPGSAGITRADLIRDLLAKAVEEHERARKRRR